MQAGYGAQSQLNYLLDVGTPGAAGGGSSTTPATATSSTAGGFGSLLQPFTAQYMQQYSPAYQFQLQQGQQGVLNQEQIENAFGILLSDPNVKAIFINIFGGILRVDVLAQGVVNAAKKLNVQLPIILRLEGTNVEEGRQILADSGLNFLVGSTMKEAADMAVAAAKGGK